jgi:mono/diheme cytochrome c family protein
MFRSRDRLSVDTPIAGLLMLATLACGGGSDDPDARTLTDPDVEAARATYEEESCAMCHGPDAEGTDLAPALQDLAGYWDEDRIVRYLENPAAFRDSNPSFDARRDEEYEMEMPAYDHVPESDRRVLARWLLSR